MLMSVNSMSSPLSYAAFGDETVGPRTGDAREVDAELVRETPRARRHRDARRDRPVGLRDDHRLGWCLVPRLGFALREHVDHDRADGISLTFIRSQFADDPRRR